MKFIDKWLLKCSIFCCAALLQIPFTSKLVQWFGADGMDGKMGNIQHRLCKTKVEDVMTEDIGDTPNSQKNRFANWSKEDKINVLCRVLFPAAYVVSTAILLSQIRF